MAPMGRLSYLVIQSLNMCLIRNRDFRMQQPYRMVRSIIIPLFLDQVGRLDVLRAEIKKLMFVAWQHSRDD